MFEAKLRPPLVHAELVPRPHLLALLDEAAARSLTVVSAPTGYGKTTLLSTWARRSTAGIAWVTLEASDSDPVRLLQYVVAALVRAGVPIDGSTQRSVGAPGADLAGIVIPQLIDDMAAHEAPVVLILDDYHLVSEPRCHELLARLIGNRPAALRIVLATRSDPPLPLGRLRAARELLEVRQPQLRFDGVEAGRFLNDVLALDLDSDEVSALEDRTEGWPAGLYLAALSLRSSADRAAFIRGFAGSSRHVVDYLGPEMLDRLDPETRTFLLQTSVLERLTGPLCDAVTGMTGSAARLRALHQDNMFMAALDDEGTWYRYHRLFAEVLRSILADESPDLIPGVHRRAAGWLASQGELELVVRHALLAGERERAALELARGWRQLSAAGRFDTLQSLLDALGPDRGTLTAPLACIEAINAGLRGLPRSVTDDLLAIAESAPWQGPMPDGRGDITTAIATVRAQLIGTDLSVTIAAARSLVGRTDSAGLADANGRACLGMALMLAGDPSAALEILDGFAAPMVPLTHVYGQAAKAMAMVLAGDAPGAERVAGDTLALARERGLESTAIGGVVALALGVAVARQGRIEESEPWLDRAVASLAIPGGTLLHAYALLRLAAVTGALRRDDRARALTREARAIVDGSPDPGALPTLLHEVERGLDMRVRRRLADGDMPSEAELRVLRLLAGPSSRSEIARALYVSPNTVKTQIGAINRKLGTATRAEAVARARELDLI